VRIACLQLGPPAGEPKEERVRAVAERVGAFREADLIVLPELWPAGYFDFGGYERDAEPFPGRTVDALRAAARTSGAHIAGGSVLERTGDGELHNTAFLLDPAGELVLSYRKIHTFGYESLESRLLTGGESVAVTGTALGRVGLTTCYDLRFPELYRLMLDQGAELVVVPAAWPRARTEHWLLLTRARALENQVFLVACNAAGEDHGTALAGTSLIADPWGEIVAQAGRGEETLVADIDPERLGAVRDEFPVLSDRRLTPSGEVAGNVR
jgi:predicted amidohydrolase